MLDPGRVSKWVMLAFLFKSEPEEDTEVIESPERAPEK
jgi:hypothetical protein